jgi:trk system potassium uptake protein TrkA
MNILVIGCGRLGAELAFRLYRHGHQVTVVDQTATAFSNLPPAFRGRLLEGEVLSQDLLNRARVAEADAVAVVTSSDAVNAVVGHVAREVYGVTTVAVRNFDPRRRRLQEAFDLPMVSSSTWGAGRFEEILTASGVRAVMSAGNGEVEVFEVAVPETCSGRALGDLLGGCELQAVALTRTGRARLPAEDIVLEAGDTLLVSGTLAGAQALQARLTGIREA